MFKPFSDNIIFFDTEFSSLNPYEGELLSVGLVKLDGRELYLELEYDGKVSDWVRENVIQFLTEKKVSREEAAERIKEFVGKNKPYVISHVNQFDAVYFYKLVGTENTPFFWIPIDFASILFALGMDPGFYHLRDENDFYDSLEMARPQNYRKHHALDDAKLLREVYLKFLEKRAKA
ncbi:MAG: 3'-5' exoribonuclease [bacterium]|nr:3'-5' exoribonuclease [bacterium]